MQTLSAVRCYVRYHSRAGGEGQQAGEQRLQLVPEGRRGFQQHRLQAGQSGQLNRLIRTRQRLQQEWQQLAEKSTLNTLHIR